jgi:hypothetical protein
VTPTAWPLAEPLDDYLLQVVQTLKQATSQGMRHLDDSPSVVTRTIEECQSMLEVIMQGDVQAWVG